MSELFEKPEIKIDIDENKSKFTPEQKKAFVERMKKARESKLLQKAQELADASNGVVVESPVVKIKKPRKPRQKKNVVASQSPPPPPPPATPTIQSQPQPQPQNQYDYSYINKLNDSINLLNNNLNSFTSRQQQTQKQEIPKQETPKQETTTQETPKQQIVKKVSNLSPRIVTQLPTSQTAGKLKAWNVHKKCYVYV